MAARSHAASAVKMPIRFAIFVVVVVLCGCASQAVPENSYNRGVGAFRVKDYAAARGHWLKASEEGEVSALNNLGYLLFYGLGGELDQDRAVVLWKRAALMGHSEAQWHLGHAFELGEGIQRSDVEAYAWYRCAIASAERAPEGERDVESQIAGEARKSLASLLAKLAPDQLGPAEQLARRYIEAHVRPGGA